MPRVANKRIDAHVGAQRARTPCHRRRPARSLRACIIRPRVDHETIVASVLARPSLLTSLLTGWWWRRRRRGGGCVRRDYPRADWTQA